jgi:GNAT superfamily N-acetyltransferase
MRCVTAYPSEDEANWIFHRTGDCSECFEEIAEWRTMPWTEDIALTPEQNHDTQTVMFFFERSSDGAGWYLHGVAKYVSGALDPALVWLCALVVAPDARGRGLGTLYLGALQAFLRHTQPQVKRIGLTPQAESKRFWMKRGFAALPHDANKLSDVIQTLRAEDSGFANASLHGVEVWVSGK